MHVRGLQMYGESSLVLEMASVISNCGAPVTRKVEGFLPWVFVGLLPIHPSVLSRQAYICLHSQISTFDVKLEVKVVLDTHLHRHGHRGRRATPHGACAQLICEFTLFDVNCDAMSVDMLGKCFGH